MSTVIESELSVAWITQKQNVINKKFQLTSNLARGVKFS